MAVILQTTFSNAFLQSKRLLFYRYFAELYSHGSNVLEKKEIVKNVLSTDTRFFGAEVLERSGYLYTHFSPCYIFRYSIGCHSKGFTIKSQGCWYAL